MQPLSVTSVMTWKHNETAPHITHEEDVDWGAAFREA